MIYSMMCLAKYKISVEIHMPMISSNILHQSLLEMKIVSSLKLVYMVYIM